ncbi:MAG: hypothetical protein LUE93_11490 [Bacteroides sp.]|nr:hypothetical protein [Bacteroides sp.]
MGTIKERNFSLDILRVIACYLVVQVHMGEGFYIGSEGEVITGDSLFWVNLYNSMGARLFLCL